MHAALVAFGLAVALMMHSQAAAAQAIPRTEERLSERGIIISRCAGFYRAFQERIADHRPSLRSTNQTLLGSENTDDQQFSRIAQRLHHLGKAVPENLMAASKKVAQESFDYWYPRFKAEPPYSTPEIDEAWRGCNDQHRWLQSVGIRGGGQ